MADTQTLVPAQQLAETNKQADQDTEAPATVK